MSANLNDLDLGVEVVLEAFDISVLGIAIVRIRVRPVSFIANKLDLLSMSAPGTDWLVPPSSLSSEAREDEGYEQDTASCSQGDNRDKQVLLLSLEVVELLGIWGCGGVAIARNRTPDVRSLNTLRGEKFRTIRIDSTDSIVTLRANTVYKEVGNDVLGASRLLGDTQVTVTILFHERSAVAQPASDERGVKEGGCWIGLISDDDDGVLQGAVPWTGEPFDSTSGPSVTIVAGLRELDTD